MKVVTRLIRVGLSILAVAAGAALSACAPVAKGQSANLQSLSRQRVVAMARANAEYMKTHSEQELGAAVGDTLSRNLKDPSSVQVRNLRLVNTPNGPLGCGQMNAKNSYGAYVGFRRFVASYNNAVIEEVGGKYREIDELTNTGLFEACGRG